MDEAVSYRILFILGCPRSGTTWLQLLLANRDGVATAPETHIFSYYINRWRRQWHEEHAARGAADRGRTGLSQLLGQEEFDDLCRDVARWVLNRIAAREPGASVVVEKSPMHALHAEYIQRLFPEAYVLHVVRDPRDTVASLLAAGRSWGSNWAPRNVIDAARLWRLHVERARALAGHTPRYREVRYESMQEDAVTELYEILQWLEMPTDRESCAEIVEAHSLARLKRKECSAANQSVPAPGERIARGFFRRGTVGGWRDDLTRMEARVVEHLCQELMARLGYERALRPVVGLSEVRTAAHDTLRRVRESVDWQLQRLSYWI